MPDKIDGDASANGTPDAATATEAPTSGAAGTTPAPVALWRRRRWMLVTAGIVTVIGVAAVGYSLATTGPGEPAAYSPAPATSDPGRRSPTPTGSTALSATPQPSLEADGLVADGLPVAGVAGTPNEPPPPPPVLANPPPGVTRPAAPTGVNATAVDYYSIRVRWTDASSNEDGFSIQVYGTGRIEVAANTTSYLVTDLLPKATRCFAVAASNAAGSSAFAPTNGWACATTPALPPVTLPAAPSDLTTGTGSSSTGDLFVVAQWRDNSDNEDGFRVHVADASYQTIDMFGIAPNSTQYSLLAQPGVVYCFRVQAFNSAGYSDWTSWACRSIEPVPAAPSNVSVTAISHDTVRIVWTDNSTNETGFRVRHLVHGALILRNLPANTTSYDWSGLPPATQVCFQVIAQGYGGPSPGVPGAPGACTTTLAAL